MDPNSITYFGETDARNKKIRFGIKAKDRLKHVYVIGKTGMGKSTLLENMAIQDIQNGNGIAFIDPHGGTAEKLLEYVPESRVKDVLYFAPFDMEYPVSFNVMEDIGADKRHLVVNGLMSTFEKIWVDAWSARMAYILNNTLLALLEYPGSTLLGVNRMLADKEFRKKVVDNITDSSVKSFWVDEFAKYTERFAAEATPAIQNKVGQFTSNPLVRNLIGQSKSTFDIRQFMDERKILIINLSKGRVGEGNANLIGSMLITKIYLAAMSRADRSEAELAKLPNFYLYVDEFQSFANKSFADILSEARKYKLNLTIAHQYIEQMEEEVRDAVFGNVGTMITFRVGAFDAEVLEKEFSPIFTAEDLVNLGFTQIYLKLMIDGVSSAPFSATTMGPIAKPDISYKEQVIQNSRMQYARPRTEVEGGIQKWYDEGTVKEVRSSGAQGMSTTAVPVQQMQPKMNTPLPPRESRPLQTAHPIHLSQTAPAVPAQNIQTPDPNKIAFAKAAEELRKRKEIVPDTALHAEGAKTPYSNQPATDKVHPVSLSSLKTDKKQPTQENMSLLKNALADVMKRAQEKAPLKKIEEQSKEIQQEKSTEKPFEKKSEKIEEKVGSQAEAQPKTEEKKPEPRRVELDAQMKREVPESVLRDLLAMEPLESQSKS